jgi:hypothetical protein
MATDLTNLDVTLTVVLNTIAQKSLDLSVPEDELTINESLTSVFGDGMGENDQIWHDQRTLAPLTGENLDLTELINAFGGTANFVTVHMIYIQSILAATGSDRSDLQIGPGSSTDSPVEPFLGWFSDDQSSEILGPGDISLHTDWYDGWPTDTGGSGVSGILRLENMGGSDDVVYNIVIIGVNQ